MEPPRKVRPEYLPLVGPGASVHADHTLRSPCDGGECYSMALERTSPPALSLVNLCCMFDRFPPRLQPLLVLSPCSEVSDPAINTSSDNIASRDFGVLQHHFIGDNPNGLRWTLDR